MRSAQRRMHLLPRPPGRWDSWCSPGSNSSAHFIIKGWGASRLFPAIDVSYIRHKILLTLCRPAPTLLVEQGFAGCFRVTPPRRNASASVAGNTVPEHAVPLSVQLSIRLPSATRMASQDLNRCRPRARFQAYAPHFMRPHRRSPKCAIAGLRRSQRATRAFMPLRKEFIEFATLRLTRI